MAWLHSSCHRAPSPGVRQVWRRMSLRDRADWCAQASHLSAPASPPLVLASLPPYLPSLPSLPFPSLPPRAQGTICGDHNTHPNQKTGECNEFHQDYSLGVRQSVRGSWSLPQSSAGWGYGMSSGDLGVRCRPWMDPGGAPLGPIRSNWRWSVVHSCRVARWKYPCGWALDNQGPTPTADSTHTHARNSHAALTWFPGQQVFYHHHRRKDFKLVVRSATYLQVG
jgi:hypothetical protein